MLKYSISYEDFDGNPVTETLYFNISKSEIVEQEIDGLSDLLKKVSAPEASGNEKIATFKKIIALSYGEKSDDGRRFRKSKELSDEFLSSPAYDALFMELIMGGNDQARAFIAGMMPKDLTMDQVVGVSGGVKVNLPDTTPPALPITSVLTPPVSPPPAAPSPAADPATPAAFQNRHGFGGRQGHGPQQRAPQTAPAAPADGVPEVVPALDQMTEEELAAELAKRRAAKAAAAATPAVPAPPAS